VIQRLAQEIAAYNRENPDQRVLIGHGSGSFGHVPAEKYGTRQGVYTPQGWLGYIEVWREAWQLHQLVMEALEVAGLPSLSFPPSACVVAAGGAVEKWDLEPLQSALEARFFPVVYGDVVFDRKRGGTILSTEELFDYLALHFNPGRILLAGIEPGVWRDYPMHTEIVSEITPEMFPEAALRLGGSSATDVTGGMASKVQQSLDLVRRVPGLELIIFSGAEPGLVQKALEGKQIGTLIRASH
jgi:isopentenyl phosphate kinase